MTVKFTAQMDVRHIREILALCVQDYIVRIPKNDCTILYKWSSFLFMRIATHVGMTIETRPSVKVRQNEAIKIRVRREVRRHQCLNPEITRDPHGSCLASKEPEGMISNPSSSSSNTA